MFKQWKAFVAALVATVVLMGLAGCGEAPKEEAKPAPAPKAEAEAPKAPEKLKAGFVYVSPIGDAGYSYAHDQGRLALEAQDWATTSFVESVPEGADSERVIRKFAQEGFDIIFTTSFGYMDPTIKVGKEFPEQAFMHCSGYKASENVSNYFGRIYQARYLTGLVAGKMTKNNVIGYVAAFPIPEVIRGINAFTLGAQEVNPDVKVHVVWTKTWYDPVKEKDAAKSLLNKGCDIIAQHQDSPGPQEAAQEAGAYSVGYNSDMSAFAPKAHLTSAVWNWAPLYVEMAQAVKDGTWKGGQALWWGMDKGVVDIAPFGPMVPEDVQKMVLAKKDEIKAGKDMIFAGPIKDQKGEVKIADGTQADDGALLGMTWFVEGVVGTTE